MYDAPIRSDTIFPSVVFPTPSSPSSAISIGRLHGDCRMPTAVRQFGMSNLERLDLRGMECPHVAISTKRKLLSTASGTRLEVICDDPLAPLDLHMLCDDMGHRIERISESGSDWHVVIMVDVGRPSQGWPVLD